jgi:trimeric autotransporter adhesin
MKQLTLLFCTVLLPVVTLAQSSTDLVELAGKRKQRELRATLERERSAERARPPFVSGQEPLVFSKGTWQEIDYSNSVDGGSIYTMLAVGDSVFVGGDFTEFKGQTAYHIALYNSRTGTVQDLDLGTSGVVRALAYHEGKLYAGGNFSDAGDESVDGLAVWDGQAWGHIPAASDGTIYDLAIYKGKLVAAGNFTEIDGITVNGIAIYDNGQWKDIENGVRWSDNTGAAVYTLLPKGDSLFVGGSFSRVGDLVTASLALWDGANWQQFDEGLDAEVSSLAWFEDKLWIGGDFYRERAGGLISKHLIVWDGQFTAAGSGADRYVETMIVVGDTLYIAGDFLKVNGVKSPGVIRYTNGEFSAVGGGVYGHVTDIAHSNGRIFAGGAFTRAGGFNAQSFAAFGHTDGAWKQGFASGVSGSYQRLFVDVLAVTDKYVYAAGSFLRAGGKATGSIAAFDRTTRTWSALGAGVDGAVQSIVTRGTEVFVAGNFNRAGDVEARGIAKWDEATRTWSALGEGGARVIAAIDADQNYVYAPVYFDDVDEFNYIGRWNGTAWEPIPGAFRGYARGLRMLDSKLYLGGFIFDLDGELMRDIAMYDGQGWQTLGSGIDGNARDFELFKGQLYAAGDLRGTRDEEIVGVMRYNGNDWESLGAGVNDYVLSIHPGPVSLFAGGWITRAGSQTVSALAQWDGSAWSAMEDEPDHAIFAIAGDTKSIFVGGYLGDAGDTESWRFGQFNLTPSKVEDEKLGEIVSFDIHTREVIVRAFVTDADLYDALGRNFGSLSVTFDGSAARLRFPDTIGIGAYYIRVRGEHTLTIPIYKY